jgi:hypothetical protein
MAHRGRRGRQRSGNLLASKSQIVFGNGFRRRHRHARGRGRDVRALADERWMYRITTEHRRAARMARTARLIRRPGAAAVILLPAD